MTANEITSMKFDKSAFGYKADEVDTFLAKVASEFDALTKKYDESQMKLEILANKIEEYREDENNLKDALLGAQKLRNAVVKEAEDKAKDIVEQANRNAVRIQNDATVAAKTELATLRTELAIEQKSLDSLKVEVSEFKSKLLAIYKTHLDSITAIPDDKKVPVAEEVKEEAPAPVEEAPAPVETAPAPEAVEEESMDLSSGDEIAAEEETPEQILDRTFGKKDEADEMSKIFFNRFQKSEGSGSSDSKYGDLHFGRNSNKDDYR